MKQDLLFTETELRALIARKEGQCLGSDLELPCFRGLYVTEKYSPVKENKITGTGVWEEAWNEYFGD